MGVAVAMARVRTRAGGAPAPVIDHGRFGPVRASFPRASDAVTWECLDLVATRRGPVDLEFEADTWGPTAAHEQQLDAIVDSLDALTESAARAVAVKFDDCDESLRGDASGLEWQGARVTGRAGTFQLHYWCRKGQELLLAVSFDRWEPTSVEVHD